MKCKPDECYFQWDPPPLPASPQLCKCSSWAGASLHVPGLFMADLAGPSELATSPSLPGGIFLPVVCALMIWLVQQRHWPHAPPLYSFQMSALRMRPHSVENIFSKEKIWFETSPDRQLRCCVAFQTEHSEIREKWERSLVFQCCSETLPPMNFWNGRTEHSLQSATAGESFLVDWFSPSVGNRTH